MTPQQKKDILTAYLQLKTEEQSWQEVIGTASDLKALEATIRASAHTPTAPPPTPTQPEPTSRIIGALEQDSVGDIPVKEMAIPHNLARTQELLKLSDYDLVDRLFPDYSKSTT